MGKREKFEQFLRHIMCIFLGLETLLLCVIAVSSMDNGYFSTQLRFHAKDLGSVFGIALLCMIPIICTILSIRFRGFYLFYEGIHVFLGFMAFIVISNGSVLFGIIAFAAESLRFIIYCILNHRYDARLTADDERL